MTVLYTTVALPTLRQKTALLRYIKVCRFSNAIQKPIGQPLESFGNRRTVKTRRTFLFRTTIILHEIIIHLSINQLYKRPKNSENLLFLSFIDLLASC